MRIIIAVFAVCLVLSGCATPGNIWKEIAGVSTTDIEKAREDAVSKVFAYDYKTCYRKVEELLRLMPNVSVYAKGKDMIAIYVIHPDTTPVGIFFKQVDAAHTQVEISSPSTPIKEWVAKNIFLETVQKPQELMG